MTSGILEYLFGFYIISDPNRNPKYIKTKSIRIFQKYQNCSKPLFRIDSDFWIRILCRDLDINIKGSFDIKRMARHMTSTTTMLQIMMVEMRPWFHFWEIILSWSKPVIIFQTLKYVKEKRKIKSYKKGIRTLEYMEKEQNKINV